VSRVRRLIVLDLILLAASVGVYVARFPIEDENPDATPLVPIAFFAGVACLAALVVLLVLALVLRVRARSRPRRTGTRG
jgi:Na+/proline symporter